MKNIDLSQLILSDHPRIEAAISTGAAWELWFQVEFLMLLRAAKVSGAREVPYPAPNQSLRLDILARHNLDNYAIELKVESATNAGNKLLAETQKDILKLAKYSDPVSARWAVALGYSAAAKQAMQALAANNKGKVIYHEAGPMACMISTV